MNKSKLLDYCSLCGKKLQDNRSATRLMHDIMEHVGYLLTQANRIEKCIDDGIKYDIKRSRKNKEYDHD